MARSFIFGRQAPIVQKVDNAMTDLKVLGYNFCQGHPTAILGKISVRKTIRDLKFSEHLL